METTTIRLDNNSLSQIEYIKLKLLNELPIMRKWNTSEIIRYCIFQVYQDMLENLE